MTKKDFDKHLKDLNITKKYFTELVNLPYSTVNNWNGIDKPFPAWLNSWFENYEKALKFDKIKELIKDEI